MKTNSTRFRYFIAFVTLLLTAGFKLHAQSLSIDPSSTQNITAGSSISFEADPSNYNGSGNNYSYSWSVTTVAGTSNPGSVAAGVTLSGSVTSTGQSGSQTRSITFANPGTYYVSCNVIRSSTNRTTSIVTVNVAPPPTPTVSVSPASSSVVLGGTASFTASPSNFPGGGSYTYTWSVSPGVAGVDYVIPSGNSASKTITFNNQTSYTVTVIASRSSQTANASAAVSVFVPNLYSTSGSGSIRAYEVNPVTGVIINGPVSIADPVSSTAALGKSRVTAADGEGRLYYLPNTSSNGGSITIYSLNPSGGASTNVGTIDMNGSSTTDLGFVRLAFDQNGIGWIVAGDGSSNVYIASFRGRGSNAIDQVNTYGNTPLTFSGAGSASEFQNGDIAFGPNNTLYALANISGGNTYVYTLNSTANPTTLTRRWTVQNGGNVFSGSVNGIAWTITGSMHLSSGDGIYFIDQTTANGGAGTVQATKVLDLSNLTDLASSEFPAQSSLPVSFGDVTVKKAGTNAEVNWSTLVEITNDHFIVERSDDAVNFKAVDKVATKNGNSSFTQYYSYVDAIGSANAVIYYRIKQVDTDGNSSYSKIVALRLGNARISNFTAYPNPFVSNVKLQIDVQQKEEVMIRINSLAGQTLATKRMTLQAGNNIVVLDNLEKLQPGTYILEVITKEGRNIQKLIKN
nr:T9SS type A sorting domain-containing protein [uncultured Lacibacter sp.]